MSEGNDGEGMKLGRDGFDAVKTAQPLNVGQDMLKETIAREASLGQQRQKRETDP
jgi:hypothetical protein